MEANTDCSVKGQMNVVIISFLLTGKADIILVNVLYNNDKSFIAPLELT